MILEKLVFFLHAPEMTRILQVPNLVDLDAVQELRTCNAMDVEG
jgi:hypothetical protein